MDLYNFMGFETFLLVPFICYFLFFNKNNGRSLYTGRDIFYPVKLYLAKRVVKAVQDRNRSKREKLLQNDVEPEVPLASNENCYCQSFSGCDQKGNSLMLKFTLRSRKTAEVILVLKLADGCVYSFPGNQKVHITSVKENKWKINGLLIETLEPYRRVRIVYNGLLQNTTCKSYENIEHVQFNFIFNCCSSPKFFPEDCDTDLLAETLAARPWRDASWKQFLNDHQEGYEQFGALLGVVSGDRYPEKLVLNLPACRSKYEKPDELSIIDREIRIFVAETNGVLISLTLQMFHMNQSQLNYGYICHKNLITVPITSQDIRVQNLGKNKLFPDMFIARIAASSDEYSCVFNINKPFTSPHKSETGYELHNVFAECDVNTSFGKALLEFEYVEHDGNLNQLKLKPILSEKKVDALPKDFVVQIRSENAKILDITGGKGNSLALLMSLHSDEFIVPNGFIITVNAFRRQLAENKLLQEAIDNIEAAFYGKNYAKMEEVCELAVLLFTNEPVHPEIERDIIESLNDVKDDSTDDSIDVVSWAVRSSAIGEDSETLSAAGQNETILGCVTEDEILRAVSKCWASLFSYQSVQYRWQHGIPIKSDMAVVVQRMVPAETAGVLFTWHPTSSSPAQMVVTSNFGLGESVVSGKVDPDSFILNRTYDGKVCLLDQIIGAKDKILTLTERGVKEISVPDGQEGSFVFVDGKNEHDKWSLTKEQVLKIGRVGLLLEDAFGGPRDIEWAFYKGVLYLLQSRPITTLNSWTDFELTHEFDTATITENSMYTLANCGEVYPMALSALTRKISVHILDRGVQANISDHVERYFLKSISTFQHRAMIDCILSLYVHERKEEIQMATKVLDLAIFGHPVVNEKINLIVRNRLGPLRPFHSIRETFRQWRASRKMDTLVKKAVEFAKSFNIEIKDEDDALTIYKEIMSKEELLFTPASTHGCTSMISCFWQMVCMVTLVGKAKELTTEHYADFANILSSCDDVESAEVPLYLEKIAKIVIGEGYAEEFCTINPELGATWLEAKCPAAYKVFEEFLERHGHRCLGEFDLMAETWGLNQSQVIPMVQANTKHMKGVSKEYKTIDQVINNLVSPIDPVSKKILKYTLSKLRGAVGKREQSKSALILSIHKCRLAYRKLAEKMVAEGLIPSENLIYHLTSSELGEVIKRGNPLLINKALKREKLYWNWNSQKFAEIQYGIPRPDEVFQAPVELLPGSKCTGTPVCTGSVQARACVITHLDEIGALQKGDILITYSTDIGWSPYFPMLSGVVTELGGLVSHGAVVAREYGLPCIVGVKNVTKMFKTGDTVFLSGKTGELGRV